MVLARSYSCSGCGHSAARWFGRCPECNSWNSAENSDSAPTGALDVSDLARLPAPADRFPSGIAEVDQVLGGGFVRGAAVLFAGEPGIGKSTLVLQVMDGLRKAGRKPLLVTGEESLDQVSLRARRLGVDASLRAAASCSLPAVLSGAARERPDVLLVDSIQTLSDPDTEQSAGSPTQVRDCAAALVRFAKETSTTVLLVGQVTKDGSVAGPKVLEHVVDAVLTLEGERTGAVRLLRASKNRFGSCEETGVFVMEECGLRAVADPSAMLLADRRGGVPGSTVFPALEGTRPLLVELQALVAPGNPAQARRVTNGIDPRRLALLLGVLSERAHLPLAAQDVFVAAMGGLAIREPAADLSLCLALFSATHKVPVDARLVAVGEVGLAGEIRRVPGTERRLIECARLGFEIAIVPEGLERKPRGIQVIVARELRDAFESVAGSAVKVA